jgi:hypothetical protein
MVIMQLRGGGLVVLEQAKREAPACAAALAELWAAAAAEELLQELLQELSAEAVAAVTAVEAQAAEKAGASCPSRAFSSSLLLAVLSLPSSPSCALSSFLPPSSPAQFPAFS